MEIELRPVEAIDLPILYEHQRDPEANAMAAFPARELDAFLLHWNKLLANKSVIVLSVVVDGVVAGNVGSWTRDGQHMVGYWLGKKFWGRGIATRMLTMFLRRVVHRPLYACVAKQNIASIRVLEKCGFELNRHLTNSLEKSSDGFEELVYVLKESGL